MKKYQYILFDWDGCLANSLPVWLRAYHTVFNQYGVSLSDKEITEKVFGNLEASKNYGIQDSEEFMNTLLTTVNGELETVDLNPFAKETVEQLARANMQVAVITTSTKSAVLQALEHHNMINLFSLILTKEDVDHHKPHPEVINKAIELLKGDLNEAIIIGDSKKDLGAAQNANIDSVLYYPSHNAKFYELATLQTFNPTFIINDLQDLLSLLQAESTVLKS